MARINAQYNVARPDSLPVRIAAKMRRVMYDEFLARCAPSQADTILDVGVTSENKYEASNYLEAWYPHKDRITACGIDDCAFLEAKYPGLRFVRADGCALPFADGAFDFVHSSAVLEHVGNREMQLRLLIELRRVARRGVFFTTPNRWFPVEFHSVLPLLHWLPSSAFRACLRALGHAELADEAHLNLLTPAQVRSLCIDAMRDGRVTVDCVRLWGWPSNIIAHWHADDALNLPRG